MWCFNNPFGHGSGYKVTGQWNVPDPLAEHTPNYYRFLVGLKPIEKEGEKVKELEKIKFSDVEPFDVVEFITKGEQVRLIRIGDNFYGEGMREAMIVNPYRWVMNEEIKYNGMKPTRVYSAMTRNFIDDTLMCDGNLRLKIDLVAKEMTIGQIEEALGYRIKIIKED